MIWKATGGRVLVINKFAVNLRLPRFLLLRQNVDLRRMNTTGVQLLRILWSNDSDDTNSERGWKIH